MATEDNAPAVEQEAPAERKEGEGGDALRKVREQIEQENAKVAESLQIMKEGKGRLRLEKPIRAASTDIEELVYDFTELTGSEYIDAMDGGPNPASAFGISYRQALTLFAIAAAKQTDKLDARDILERIGMTDAATGEQLARLFFSASTRAGRQRISKR